MMPRALPCPNCGCGPDCTLVATDTFATDTIANYTIVSQTAGTWNVSSGKLQTPSVGILRHNTSTPVSPDGVKVGVIASAGSGTGKMGAIVDYSDSSNYHYVEVEATGSTAATLRLIKVASGSPTTLASSSVTSFSWSSPFTIEACWDGTYLAGTVITSAVTSIASATTGIGGNYTGLRTVNAQLSATFDDLAITSLAEGCDRCGDACTDCDHGSFQVDVAGVANGSCSDCAALNQSYIIERVPPDSECTWGYGEEQTCAGTQDWTVFFSFNTGTGNLLGEVAADGGVEGASFEKSSPDACDGWNVYDIPRTATAGAQCNFSSATFKITAL